MKYRTCPKCGSNLDYGERCDCEKGGDDTCEVKAVKTTERRYSDYGKNEFERACRRGA